MGVSEFAVTMCVVVLVAFFLIDLLAMITGYSVITLASRQASFKTATADNLADALSEMQIVTASFALSGLGKFARLKAVGGYNNSGADLFINATQVSTGTTTQIGPNLGIPRPVEADLKVYESAVRLTYEVGPLVPFMGVPLISDIQGCGKPAIISVATNIALEHPERLAVSAVGTSTPPNNTIGGGGSSNPSSPSSPASPTSNPTDSSIPGIDSNDGGNTAYQQTSPGDYVSGVLGGWHDNPNNPGGGHAQPNDGAVGSSGIASGSAAATGFLGAWNQPAPGLFVMMPGQVIERQKNLVVPATGPDPAATNDEDNWVDTQIDVRPDNRISLAWNFFESGRWSHATTAGSYDADGTAQGTNALGLPLGVLIGKIGRDGEKFRIGRDFYNYSPADSGWLFLRMNDDANSSGDNQGEQKVTVFLTN